MTEQLEQQETILHKFTNHEHSPELDHLLAMFYHATFTNKIGIMQALNEQTGKEEIILVGIEPTESGHFNCYPLAKALTVEETKMYSAPDGKGGWNSLKQKDVPTQ